MDIWQFVAGAATVFVALQWVPELVQAWKTRKLNDLSWLLTFFGLAGSLLFFAYGVHLSDPFIIATNAFISLCLLALMGMKWMFEK